MDADEGSITSGGATSFDEVADKVVDGHDNSGVVNFGDGGGASADVGDLLNELFGGESEIVVDGLWDRLWVEWWDWESGRCNIDCMDFVTIASNERVLFREFFEHGGKGNAKDPASLGGYGRVLCGHLLVHL
jgi:hypothetical protein